MTLYALHDSDPRLQRSGAIQIGEDEAFDANKNGYGIFWTVNSFNGRRTIDNLKKINSWAIDMDNGTKPEMIEKIKSGLVPSMVVETKKGFHVYFSAKDGQPKHWESIVLDRLVPFYNADKRARDMARILRVPGYYHMKNPQDPFMIRKVWEHDVSYSEKDIAYFYQDTGKEKRENFVAQSNKSVSLGDSFWEKVYRLDCMEALEKISGQEIVNKENFSFRKTGSGNWNILVDGKSTSTWVDKDGHIGSLDGGGPSIYNWICWYGRAPGEAAAFIESFFFPAGEANPSKPGQN